MHRANLGSSKYSCCVSISTAKHKRTQLLTQKEKNAQSIVGNEEKTSNQKVQRRLLFTRETCMCKILHELCLA